MAASSNSSLLLQFDHVGFSCNSSPGCGWKNVSMPIVVTTTIRERKDLASGHGGQPGWCLSKVLRSSVV